LDDPEKIKSMEAFQTLIGNLKTGKFGTGTKRKL